MSEERATYMGETPEEHTYQIKDEGPHDYFFQVPNLVDDLNLSPYAFRLYGHLRRVAGEKGECWQSTSTLATACRMSSGMVSQAKDELEKTFPPLIRIRSEKGDKGIYHIITICDIWKINHEYWANPGVVHLVKAAKRSPSEKVRSPSERKNTPIKNTPLPEKKPDGVDAMLLYQDPKAVQKKQIQDALESGLRVNLTGPEVDRVIRKIVNDLEAHPTRSIEKWLRWARNEKRIAYLHLYSDPRRIWSHWPSQDGDDNGSRYEKSDGNRPAPRMVDP